MDRKLLLVTGLLAIILSAGAIVTAIGWQDWENWVFDQDSRNEPATIGRYLAEKKDQIVADMALVQTRGWRAMMKRCNGSSRSKMCSKDGTLTERSSFCA